MKWNHSCLSALLFLSLIPAVAGAQQAQSLENFNSNDVSIIDITSNGKVWVGTPIEGCAVDSAGIWSPTFDSTNSAINGTATQAMRSNNVTAICLYKISGVAHSFMGTAAGLAYRYGTNWDTLPGLPLSSVTGIVRSSDDSLWIATASGIFLYNDTTLQPLTYYNTPLGADSTAISCMQSNISGSTGFALGTIADGFFYTTDGATFTQKTVASGGLAGDSVNCIYTEVGGANYYVGTRSGLSIDIGGTLTTYTTANGLPGNDITTLTKDCENRLWIGTRDSGLAIYNGSTFRIFNTTNGLSSNHITSISCDPSCTCWIGTSDMGIIKIDSSLTQVADVNLPSGITTIDDGAPIRIYPQPASAQVTFSLPQTTGVQVLSIMDVGGRILISEPIIAPQMVLGVDRLAEGVYIYRISSDEATNYRGKLLIAR